MSITGAMGGKGGNIYLSPHRDDAAFSLGALIARTPGGTLVNIFTRSEYVAVPLPLGDGMARADVVSALRAAEDAGFVARYGLEQRDLGLDEPSMRGRAIFGDPAQVEPELPLLRAPLTAMLDELVADGPRLVFCPAGIGGHADHLLTRRVTLEWAVSRDRLGLLRFYEDLPYAHKRRVRAKGLRWLQQAVPTRLRRTAWPAGEEKLVALSAYPSQHRHPPTLQQFRPAAVWPIGPHEAVWGAVTER